MAGILDADMDYGDGTDAILERTGEQRVTHFSAGEHYWEPGDAAPFFFRCAARMLGCSEGQQLPSAGNSPHHVAFLQGRSRRS